MERDQLLSIRNFGPRSLRELTDALTAHGYDIPATLIGAGGAEGEDTEAGESKPDMRWKRS